MKAIEIENLRDRWKVTVHCWWDECETFVHTFASEFTEAEVYEMTLQRWSDKLALLSFYDKFPTSTN